MTIMLETVTLPESGPFDISVALSGNIQVPPETARRRVSVFVGNQIADLLHGEAPDLVLGKRGIFWRVPVALSSRSLGRIGIVGTIDVNVETGELGITNQIIEEIEQHAQRLTVSTAL